MAEKEGFEPSIGLQTLYSLSRGAPSATRPPLRLCGAYNKGLSKYVKHFYSKINPSAQTLPTTAKKA